MKTLLSSFLIILLAASCRKEIIETSKNNDNQKFHPMLLWKVPIDSNIYGPITFDPVVFENDVVIYCMECEPNPKIIKLDGTTGQRKQIWDSWTNLPFESFQNENRLLVDDDLIFDVGNELISLNLNTFQLNWNLIRNNQILNPKKLYKSDYKVYTNSEHDFSGPAISNSSSIIQFDSKAKNLDTLFNVTQSDGFSPWLTSFEISKSSLGHEIIVGKNRLSKEASGGFSTEKMAVFAYNITTSTLLWYMDSVEVGHYGSALQIKCYNGLAFVPGHDFIHCFDINTGIKKWQYKVPHPIYMGDLFLHNGKLLYKDAWDNLFALDPQSGRELWKRSNLNGCTGLLTLFNNRLFYASGYLLAVSPEDGSLMYSSKNAEWSISEPIVNSPVIDPVNRRIYLSDGNFIYALKMPNDW